MDKLTPLLFLRRLFGNRAPDPDRLRVLSPRELNPYDAQEALAETNLILNPQMDRARTDDAFKLFTQRKLAEDAGIDLTDPKAASAVRQYFRDQLGRISQARNLNADVVDDAVSGQPYTYRFNLDPDQGLLFGALQSTPVSPTAKLGRFAGTGDVEEIKQLGSIHPGQGRPMLRSAQEAYDPSAERATSLMALPKAYDFYKRAGMKEIPGTNYLPEDWNWQTHVLPKGERFAEGGLARCRHA